MRVLYCSDFPDAPECCASCHFDDDEELSPLCGFRGDGFDIEACCNIVVWLRENPDRINAALSRKLKEDKEP